MKHGKFCNKRNVQLYIIVTCFVGLLLLGYVYLNVQNRIQGELKNVSASSDDKQIVITWDPLYFGDITSVQIVMNSDESTEVYTASPGEGKFVYDKGTHGVLYTFSLSTIDKFGRQSEEQVCSRLFLDYDNLPELPIITINTENGIEPTYEEAIKRDSDLWGETITNNDFVTGLMHMEREGMRTVSSEVKVRIRGNTTAVKQEKKSYKLVLSDKADLLGRGSNYADKEWVLLNAGTDFKTYIGGFLGAYFGMEWQPQMMYVNVIMNGDWKGCYILSESVSNSPTRCAVSESGYLFENDAYWWNTDGVYFKTDNQPSQFGFTFKYPDIKEINDARMSELQTYMQMIEDKIIAQDEDLFEYIDAESFAAWILVRDLMGQDDGGGSNMYYYIDSLNWDDLTGNKLKMGPLWDFDISFMHADDWSIQHSLNGTYFNYLLDNPEFAEVYRQKWMDVRTDLQQDLFEHIDMLSVEQRDALQASRNLDASRWQRKLTSVNDESAEEKIWLGNRILWMDAMLGVN